jgi:hypothetical protein
MDWRTKKRIDPTMTAAGYQHTSVNGNVNYGFIHKSSGSSGTYVRLDWIAGDAEL